MFGVRCCGWCTLLLLYAACAHDDVACLGDALEVFLGGLACCFALTGNAIGMIAQGQLAVGLAHLLVGCVARDAEGAVGFLERDVDVWMPCLLLCVLLVLAAFGGVVGGGAPEGEADRGAPEHGVDEPAEEEPEQEALATTEVHANETEYPLITHRIETDDRFKLIITWTGTYTTFFTTDLTD